MTRLTLQASRVLEIVNALANAPYRLGMRRPARVGLPVVSVGNIAVGGAGKTPLVAALVATLARLGQRPAILTRGYRRRGREPLLIGSDRRPPWELVGDEPALLARALPGVPIVVDADRVRGAARAISDTGASHLVLDDAFQHWRLARDLDIVAVDAGDPLSEHAPRREHPRCLSRADAIIITNAEPEALEPALTALRRRQLHIPILATRLRPMAVHWREQQRPVASLSGERVVAFAGIAFPQRFFATIAGLGAQVVRAVEFPDHHPFDGDELAPIIAEARALGALTLTTAKDAVRLPAGVVDEVAWLEVAVEPVLGNLEELLTPLLPS